MRIPAQHIGRTNGPFSAVRPGGAAPLDRSQEAGEGEPVDTVAPSEGAGGPFPATRQGTSMPLDGLVSQSERAAGQALAAFPQIVHVLANPELHLGAHLAEKTGLPLVSLAETAVEDLEDLLSGPQYAEGFILEGFPVDKSSLDCIDGLLSATSPDEHRVLGWTEKDSPTHQAVIDHYVDQGIMWEVPHPTRSGGPEGMKNSLLECLEGLPAFK